MIEYPIIFEPILKEKIWGGSKLNTLFNKNESGNFIGESWEVSNVPGNTSIVANGNEEGRLLSDLIKEFKEDLVGKKIFQLFGNQFPLLIKFIDAKENLSVQLHPNDDLAKERHNSFGKTEMWYVVDAEKDSVLNVGFSEKMTPKKYKAAIEEKNILEKLNFEPVKKGDTFFIKEGLVHAIGAGCLIAEIQQTSDITYRIYDWDRVDNLGNERELHTDLAIDAFDYSLIGGDKCSYDRVDNKSSQIVSCKYFTTNFLKIKGEFTQKVEKVDSFIIYVCVAGQVEVVLKEHSETIKCGQTILIPAIATEVFFKSDDADLLEVYI